ncbi:hypothetical protein LCGC14_1356640 [marine sediment metagenome]|uniref:Uncharacterized protein n=1 Tax=marine sediment metagenome TaxID=412755 RepID=A0A0F9MPS6_9ZZZZ
MLNTKCKVHGNHHPDFLCPRGDKVRQELIRCGHTIERLETALFELMTSLHPNPHAMDLAKVKDDWPAIGGRTTWGVLRRARAAIEDGRHDDAEALAGKEEYAGALDRLQTRFNEVWTQHQRMLYALEGARDIIHRTQCPAPPAFPQKCWKECEEAEDALLEAGWMPQ